MPVVLIVDAHGMGRSLLPLIAGFLHYDVEKWICGVILNRVSESFYQTIAPVIEEELNVPVFGFFPNVKDLKIESRHLGLKMPQEIADLKAQTKRAGRTFFGAHFFRKDPCRSAGKNRGISGSRSQKGKGEADGKDRDRKRRGILFLL